MIKPVLLLDVDGVIADCSTAVHKFAQRILGRELPGPETWSEWDHASAMGLDEMDAQLFNFLAKHDEEMPNSIQLYPGAAESVRALGEHFEIVFCTTPWKGNKHWVPARDKLLEQFGCDVVYTSAKHRVLGDVMLDDAPHNILRGGPCKYYVLFDRPYNQELSVGRHRVKHLFELIGYAERLRQPARAERCELGDY